MAHRARRAEFVMFAVAPAVLQRKLFDRKMRNPAMESVRFAPGGVGPSDIQEAGGGQHAAGPAAQPHHAFGFVKGGVHDAVGREPRQRNALEAGFVEIERPVGHQGERQAAAVVDFHQTDAAAAAFVEDHGAQFAILFHATDALRQKFPIAAIVHFSTIL
ncbi:hypothetical protein SDC9_97009 [bioreactor metagenome]|uniref:Uncharacterized protein n=1 Tax=bioreactor metagenome TaxID=1076179 RepID=A0A645AHC9_9ZZZZ